MKATITSVPLTGRVALVTGAARGIGSATARRLARSGAEVIVADLDLNGAVAVAKSIGGLARPFELDVTSQDGWNRLIDKVSALYAHIDILVNNAGVLAAKPIDQLTELDLKRMLAASVEGTFRGLKTCLPLLLTPARRQQFTAAVVNLGSTAGIVGMANSFAYSAAKGAVRQMSKSAAIELAPKGVRVNCVHPGFIETDLAQNGLRALTESGAATDFELARSAVQAAHPIGRLGRPEDVASAINFLVTDEASFITGADLLVDGGFTAQ